MHLNNDGGNSQNQQTIGSRLLSITTIVKGHLSDGSSSHGSGFFYNINAPNNPHVKGAGWVEIQGQWLITNRHVVLPKINDEEVIPDYFTFNLREVINNRIEWLPITYSQDELRKNLKLHSNPKVDVAVINVKDILVKHVVRCKDRMNIIMPMSLSNDNLPSVSQLEIETTSDIVVASYPRGYYDEYNKFPILKSGIIASAWGRYFNYEPVFLIDAMLFPGSSGGLVISKPTNMTMINGCLHTISEKQFAFLGVYSGEPRYLSKPIELDGFTISKSETFGLGLVWYSTLIPEIINNGVLTNL